MLNAKLPFVVFGDEWGLHATSTQHLARRLAQTNPMLYVNAWGGRAFRWNLYDVRRAWNKLGQWISSNHKVPADGLPNAHFFSPVVIPIPGFGPVRHWNKRWLVRGLRRQMEELNLESPVLFVSSPVGAEAVGGIGERLLIYYVTDEYVQMPGVHFDYMAELERTLLDRADLIFVTSVGLQHRKKGKKAQPVLLPHGVDFEHFHSAADPLCSMPEELQQLPRPILGCFGLLSSWIDFGLVEHLARMFPKASVVLIGRRWGDTDVPTNLPNVHWLGPRPYKDLPRYGAHFDVGLIPFQQNRLTSCVNPLRLLEYLALGLPVVSTPLPDLSRFADLVFQAENPNEFVQKVELALADRGRQRREQRWDLAAKESWDARMTMLWRHIEDALRPQRVS